MAILRYFFGAVLCTVLFSCTKKEGIVITNSTVKEILTRYGAENKENEVIIETSHGTMRLRLYEDVPLHRANFIKLIKEGSLENAEFYRVFSQFMIQGGIHPKELGYTIPAEFNANYIHKKGALAMARSDENNPDKESSASEFFIVQGSRYADYQVKLEEENNNLTLTPEQRDIYMREGGYMSLDQQYTIFGEVIEGFDVIDKIASVDVHNQDKPLKKIPIQIRLAESGK
jgi:cyclophilin family peptidyl-prolyl cis-trans isomerase